VNQVNIDIVTADARRHIPAIVANVRQADIEELWAASHLRPLNALWEAVETSKRAWTGMIDNKPVCMFGVAPSEGNHNSDVGRPWLIGSREIEQFSFVFLSRCRKQVEVMLEYFPVLENYVCAENKKAVSWLLWLGFTFHECLRMGPENKLFIRFTMARQ